jgi:DNA-binding CsgD family transcriptional regulator
VCFLAQKYGLAPREVTLIALITSGKNGRAISQALGIGMPKIRQHCAGFMARLAPIRGSQSVLWAIRNGMVKSAVQPKSAARVLDTYKGCPARIQTVPEESYRINNSLEGLDGQQENTVIEPGEHVALSPVSDQSLIG